MVKAETASSLTIVQGAGLEEKILRSDIAGIKAANSCGVLQMDMAGSLLQPGKPMRFEVMGSAAECQRWFGVCLLPVAE